MLLSASWKDDQTWRKTTRLFETEWNAWSSSTVQNARKVYSRTGVTISKPRTIQTKSKNFFPSNCTRWNSAQLLQWEMVQKEQPLDRNVQFLIQRVALYSKWIISRGARWQGTHFIMISPETERQASKTEARFATTNLWDSLDRCNSIGFVVCLGINIDQDTDLFQAQHYQTTVLGVNPHLSQFPLEKICSRKVGLRQQNGSTILVKKKSGCLNLGGGTNIFLTKNVPCWGIKCRSRILVRWDQTRKVDGWSGEERP